MLLVPVRLVPVRVTNEPGTPMNGLTAVRVGATTVSQPADPGDGQLLEAVDQLPPDDLELVRLVYWDDLSTEQAGAVLGIHPATARKRLQRARSRLRQLLETAPPLEGHARAVCPNPT